MIEYMRKPEQEMYEEGISVDLARNCPGASAM
jgi:hypothetical protein